MLILFHLSENVYRMKYVRRLQFYNSQSDVIILWLYEENILESVGQYCINCYNIVLIIIILY